MFTERLVSGGPTRPDFRFIAVHSENHLAEIKEGTILYNRSIIADSIPLVSFGSGLSKILAGLIHSIVHLVLAVFDKLNRPHHLQEAGLGGRSIVRGLVSIFPFLGNAAILKYDQTKQKSEIRESVKFEKGFAIFYECGREISRMDAKFYYQKLKERTLSPQELILFMKGGNISVGDNPLGGIIAKNSFWQMFGKSPEADSQIQRIYRKGGTYMDIALAEQPNKFEQIQKQLKQWDLTAENFTERSANDEWLTSTIPPNCFMIIRTNKGGSVFHSLVIRMFNDEFLSSRLDDDFGFARPDEFLTMQYDCIEQLAQKVESLGIKRYKDNSLRRLAGPPSKELADTERLLAILDLALN